MTAYGLLQTENGKAWQIFYFDGYFDKPSTPAEMRAIFRNDTMRRTFYNWVMPAAKRAFKSMPPKIQVEYLNILDHASGYLSRLDKTAYEAEVIYLAELKKGNCKNEAWLRKRGIKLPEWMPNGWDQKTCDGIFTWFRPDGQETPYRKIEAFAFRRVREGVDARTQKFWVDKTIADLKAM